MASTVSVEDDDDDDKDDERYPIHHSDRLKGLTQLPKRKRVNKASNAMIKRPTRMFRVFRQVTEVEDSRFK